MAESNIQLATGKKRFNRYTLINRFMLFALLLVELLIFSNLSPYFLTVKNFFAVGLNTSVLGIVAIGQTLCILGGDFDLSVGNTACFAGIMLGYLCSPQFSSFALPYGIALSIVLVAVAAVGLINGLLVTKFRISAFIATMSVNFILGGLIILICKGKSIIVNDPAFSAIGTTLLSPFKMPLPMILFVLLYILFALFLKNTIIGRRIFCMGGNKNAAHIAGINVTSTKIATFMISALCSGFAGIILASRMGAAQNSIGSNYAMESVAATVLGGTALSGGEGSMFGTFLGVLVTGMLSNGLIMIGVTQAWRDIATGLVLVIAIILQNITRSKRS